MIEPNDLITAGFRYYPATMNLGKGPLYQKRYEGDDGRPLYFLNVTENVEFIERYPDLADNYRWSVEAHLYLDADGDKFAVVRYMVRANTTVAEIEGFYQRAYAALGCVPDPHND